MNIYQKVFAVQQDPKMAKLVRTEFNKFQNYRYFTESQILIKLRPLLKEKRLILLFSDSKEQGFIHEKLEKEHVVKYTKKMEIIDIDKPEEKIIEEFWACGQNIDLAKAKGAADTYAIKYFLSKFFLLPATDDIDPDKWGTAK
ncbi:ERF family protein [endosymbiont GvMRE of Glomus versiforme]|uniref:ERF family protein n=1 Tax=endosymbiont GvMRE of Glomus versiforme TaxID=2039283 RepID=UPI000ED24F8C|nr:ERF family protein [endosymbiont GvMRE of Glomus versiforme]RHZ37055.1 Single-stranded DNA-binding protein [endosymbiont GvMRE of Glomus versiforme]